jgi:hypothetical protein
MSININEKVPKSPCIFFCQICDYKTCKKKYYDTHLLTAKHLKSIFVNEKVPKSPEKSSKNFVCEKCDYITYRQSHYDRHLLTAKHIQLINVSEKLPKTSKQFICKICEKIYKEPSGLWRHKQKCQLITNNKNNTTDSSNNNEFVFDKEFVISVMKQNAELQNQMMEVIKNGTHNTTNNTNTNSHNKTFNLQFFLNETCKNAMNITDFVNSIQLQLSDLENMGDVGFVSGMSSIIIKNLKDLEVHERPLHCTDIKREVLYVKDEDKWDKETDGNPKIRSAIKHIAKKNTRQLSDFKNKYPDCNKSHSKHSDKYNKLIIEAMGGMGDNDAEKENKIIKKVAKEVIVEKE